KEAPRHWRREESQDAFATGRLPEDGHIVCVATEQTDIALDPFEGCDLIEQTEVCRASRIFVLQSRMCKEAQLCEAVVDGNDDSPNVTRLRANHRRALRPPGRRANRQQDNGGQQAASKPAQRHSPLWRSMA